MPFAAAALSLALSLSSPAAVAEVCALQGTQWLQDGRLLGAVDGPLVAQATRSPEMLSVEVELTPDTPAAFVRVKDSVARIEAFLPHEELRVQMTRPMAFADDIIYIGSADLRVVAVESAGIKVAPMDLPSWIVPESTLSSPVACGDLDLVNAWRGDMRALAVGNAPRGKRVYLRGGEFIPVARTSASMSAVELRPETSVPVEEIKRAASKVRILMRFAGGVVVGWVSEEFVTDEGSGGGGDEEATDAPQPAPADAKVATCSKDTPLWVSAGGQDFMLGVLLAGADVVLGEKQDDRVLISAVPSASSWTGAEGAQWWLDAKAARKCK